MQFNVIHLGYISCYKLCCRMTIIQALLSNQIYYNFGFFLGEHRKKTRSGALLGTLLYREVYADYRVFFVSAKWKVHSIEHKIWRQLIKYFYLGEVTGATFRSLKIWSKVAKLCALLNEIMYFFWLIPENTPIAHTHTHLTKPKNYQQKDEYLRRMLTNFQFLWFAYACW